MVSRPLYRKKKQILNYRTKLQFTVIGLFQTEVEAATEKGDTDETRAIPLSTDTEGSTTEADAVQLNATNKCAILPTITEIKPTGNDEKVAVEVKCLLKKFSSEMTPNEREENVGKGVLLDSVWRNLLCRCEDCQVCLLFKQICAMVKYLDLGGLACFFGFHALSLSLSILSSFSFFILPKRTFVSNISYLFDEL